MTTEKSEGSEEVKMNEADKPGEEGCNDIENVTVDVSSTRISSSSCTFQKIDLPENKEVEDEGIHISDELNPAIFDALEKTENTRKRKIKWASKKRKNISDNFQLMNKIKGSQRRK